MKLKHLDLLKGTLALLILRSLKGHKQHGHGIMKWIRSTSDDTFLIEEGAIYPALHRLEGALLIESEWGTTDNNRQARFYRLTPRGRRRLVEETRQWQRYVAAFDQMLGGVKP